MATKNEAKDVEATEVSEVPRPRRTAGEKAAEALATAQRKVERAERRKEEAEAVLGTIDAEIARLVKERDYIASHPALQQQDEAVMEAVGEGDVALGGLINTADDSTPAEQSETAGV